MELIKPFGPEIGHTQISDEDNNTLLEIIEKNKDDPTKRTTNLVSGYIDWVFTIRDSLPPKFVNTIAKLVAEYANNATSLYSPDIRINSQELTCVSAWCNIQESSEFHLIHTHPINDLVCVIYPKVDIPHKKSIYDEALGSDVLKPGSIVFQHGATVNNFGSSMHTVFPKTKDVYIFPSDMPHYTIPVWDENYSRLSVCFNFVFNDLFYQRRKLHGY